MITNQLTSDLLPLQNKRETLDYKCDLRGQCFQPVRSRYRQSINPWPFAIVNKKGNPGLNVTFWVVFYSDSEFIAWVWTQLSYFECKSAPRKEHMHMQLPGKWKIRGHSTKKLLVLHEVCMLMTMWNVWAHEYLAILVGCQNTAYWLSAIIWSRFVNETHEYLINSFLDHRRSDNLCICTKEILLDPQKVESCQRATVQKSECCTC